MVEVSFRHERWLIVLVLLLAGGFRVIQITAPLVGHHSWRQADTAAISRNFVEEEFNLFYPRIDWRGNTEGFVEAEFPVYQATVACLYEIFGVREWLGRLTSVAFSLAALLFLYLFTRRILGVKAALWAGFFFAILPMPAFYGRTFMPESMLILCCMAGVFWFYEWSKGGSLWNLALSALFISLACLIKLPTLYIGLPLAFMSFRKFGGRAWQRIELWAYVSMVFGLVALWYYHAHWLKYQTGLTFGIWEYGTDKWGNWNLALS
ncbi:MAG: glycosyltransferase family 39 protein, partial [bacterium]